MIETFNTDFRFPKPPFRIDRSLLEGRWAHDALGAYLEEVRAWRLCVLDNVHSDKLAGMSERSRNALEIFLAETWSGHVTQWASASPYNIHAFPRAVLVPEHEPEVELVLEVLRWRASVRDLLSDIWDVMGEPLLDLDECGYLALFFTPTGRDQKTSYCYLCLTEFPVAQLSPERHGCLILSHVRAKWPAPPKEFGSEGQPINPET